MRPLLALVGVVLLGAPRALADPPVEAQLAVASARSRWSRCLDEGAWDRDRGSVRCCAEDLSVELLPHLGAGPTTDPQLWDLLTDLEGSALRDALQTQEPAERWVAAYLSRHRDPAFQASLEGTTVRPRVLAAELLARGSPLAVGYLRALWPTLESAEREALCEAAMVLPPAARAELGRVVATAGRAAMQPGTLSCAALAAETPEGLGALRGRRETVACFGDFTALLGALHGDRASSAALAQRFQRAPQAPQDGGPCGLWLNHALGAALLAWDAPPEGLRWVLRWLARRVEGRNPVALGVRLRWRDASLVDALPGLDPRIVPAVRVFLGLGARAALEPSGLAPAVRFPVDLAEESAWLEAEGAVSRCASAGCLVSLARRGADETAARSVLALGPRGLEALTAEETRPLLRRVISAETPWMTAAVLLTLRRPTAAWGSLRELLRGERPALVDAERHTMVGLTPALLALVRRAQGAP
ncbi:MAG: hypothetical protein HY909_00830 [Deltaproteobacteria bacterium]|nr:hypothetical protein [Deltaproteobacteria bacterium]